MKNKVYYFNLIKTLCSHSNLPGGSELWLDLNEEISLGNIDVEELTDALIELNDGKLIRHFIRNVRNLPIVKLTKAIIKLEDAYDLIDYLNEELSAPIDLVTDGIIAKKNCYAIVKLGKEVNGVDVKKLEDAIVEYGNNVSIYLFAKDVQGANATRLGLELCKRVKEEQIIEGLNIVYEFAKNVRNAPITELEDTIIEKGTALDIYFFARVIKTANVNKLAKALCKTRNISVIRNFITDVPNPPKEIFTKYISNLTEEEYNDILNAFESRKVGMIKENQDFFEGKDIMPILK